MRIKMIFVDFYELYSDLQRFIGVLDKSKDLFLYLNVIKIKVLKIWQTIFAITAS